MTTDGTSFTYRSYDRMQAIKRFLARSFSSLFLATLSLSCSFGESAKIAEIRQELLDLCAKEAGIHVKKPIEAVDTFLSHGTFVRKVLPQSVEWQFQKNCFHSCARGLIVENFPTVEYAIHDEGGLDSPAEYYEYYLSDDTDQNCHFFDLTSQSIWGLIPFKYESIEGKCLAREKISRPTSLYEHYFLYEDFISDSGILYTKIRQIIRTREQKDVVVEQVGFRVSDDNPDNIPHLVCPRHTHGILDPAHFLATGGRENMYQ